MTGGEAQNARILAGAMAEPIFPVVPMPLDVMDEKQFPEMARARRHLASLSPIRRAQLQSDWEN